MAQEGSIVFVRPSRYHIFGTRSLRDYVEVTLERSGRNDADMLAVHVGFRNRGGQHFWDTRGPNLAISVKTVFYMQGGGGPADVPLYETNWLTLSLMRGTTAEYQAVCPKKSAQSYQVLVSEVLH
jgi:hypothetical protein